MFIGCATGPLSLRCSFSFRLTAIGMTLIPFSFCLIKQFIDSQPNIVLSQLVELALVSSLTYNSLGV